MINVVHGTNGESMWVQFGGNNNPICVKFLAHTVGDVCGNCHDPFIGNPNAQLCSMSTSSFFLVSEWTFRLRYTGIGGSLLVLWRVEDALADFLLLKASSCETVMTACSCCSLLQESSRASGPFMIILTKAFNKNGTDLLWQSAENVPSNEVCV